jgi:hypothetical protein
LATIDGGTTIVLVNREVDRPPPEVSVCLWIRLNNVFNVKYALLGGCSNVQTAIMQDGRNVSVQLRYWR